MSLKDGEMHVVSIVGAAVLTGALFVPVLWFTDAAVAKILSSERSVKYQRPGEQRRQGAAPNRMRRCHGSASLSFRRGRMARDSIRILAACGEGV